MLSSGEYEGNLLSIWLFETSSFSVFTKKDLEDSRNPTNHEELRVQKREEDDGFSVSYSIGKEGLPLLKSLDLQPIHSLSLCSMSSSRESK